MKTTLPEHHPASQGSVNTICIRRSKAADQERILEIWCRAVDSTHDFLTPTDRVEIEREVRAFLAQAPLWLAVDESDRPCGFMLLDESHVGGLFVDPLHHGRGTGRALISHALSFFSVISVDVNEQNSRALGFYIRLGFEIIGRSEVDEEGRPYPLIHMRMNSTRHH